MNRKKKTLPTKLVFLILVIISIMLMFISYVTGFSGGPLKTVTGFVFVPMQNGLDFVGNSITDMKKHKSDMKELKEENTSLKKQVNELTQQLNSVQLQQSELKNLENLYQLDQQYTGYKKTGARIIAKGTSNFFDTFTIDKGSSSGIKKDMNVIAEGGLVGIVTETGKNYAIVKAVIDDTSNVSAMSLNTGNLCIVSGNLQTMNKKNEIDIQNLEDKDNKISQGEPIVTSNVSSKYLPGILIGYVSDLKNDSNDLTKSGTLTPAVDFKHLQSVLVILQTKETSSNETK
jgi:rod shape-determining protein MreC